jgi:phosphate transport system permease protein
MMATKHNKRSDRLGAGLTSLCSGALALNLLLVVALLAILVVNGMGYFWQRTLVEYELDNETRVLGEVHDREEIPAEIAGTPEGTTDYRIRMKLGNRDLTGFDFLWIDESQIHESREPDDAVVLERTEYGNFYGYMVEMRRGGEVLASGSDQVWEAFGPLQERKLEQLGAIRRLERREIGDVNFRLEKLRLAERRLSSADLSETDRSSRLAEIREQQRLAETEYEALSRTLFDMREAWEREQLVMQAADGTTQTLPVAHVVRAIRPNSMSRPAAIGLYLSRDLRHGDDGLLDVARRGSVRGAGGAVPARVRPARVLRSSRADRRQ